MYGNGIGLYYFSKNYDRASFVWQEDLFEQFYITKLDTINKIISGTFAFDAVNSTGKKVEIRDGRFDVKFINYEP